MPIKRTSFDFLPSLSVGRWMKAKANDSSSWDEEVEEKDTSTDSRVAILLCCCPTLDLGAWNEEEDIIILIDQFSYRSHHMKCYYSSCCCCCCLRNPIVYKRWNQHSSHFFPLMSQHSIYASLVHHVAHEKENLIRKLNCSDSWTYPFFPCRAPIIIVYWGEIEWIAWPSVSLVVILFRWQTVMMMLSLYIHMNARDLIRLGTLCACQSRQTVIIETSLE